MASVSWSLFAISWEYQQVLLIEAFKEVRAPQHRDWCRVDRDRCRVHRDRCRVHRGRCRVHRLFNVPFIQSRPFIQFHSLYLRSKLSVVLEGVTAGGSIWSAECRRYGSYGGNGPETAVKGMDIQFNRLDILASCTRQSGVARCGQAATHSSLTAVCGPLPP